VLRVNEAVQFGTAGQPTSATHNMPDPNQTEFVVHSRPLIVCCSSLSKSLVESVGHIVRRIGGYVVELGKEKQILSEDVFFTYLVASELKPTSKMLYALMCGATIVTPSFFEMCVDSSNVELAEKSGMRFPREAPFLPPLSNVQRMKNTDLMADEERFSMFSGLAFVFCHFGRVVDYWTPLVRWGNCAATFIATNSSELRQAIDAAQNTAGVKTVCVLNVTPIAPISANRRSTRSSESADLTPESVERIVKEEEAQKATTRVVIADTGLFVFPLFVLFVFEFFFFLFLTLFFSFSSQ
jgi:hypothetical protein